MNCDWDDENFIAPIVPNNSIVEFNSDSKNFYDEETRGFNKSFACEVILRRFEGMSKISSNCQNTAPPKKDNNKTNSFDFDCFPDNKFDYHLILEEKYANHIKIQEKYNNLDNTKKKKNKKSNHILS